MPHSYTPEQREFIKEHVKGRTSTELVEMFNEQFGLQLGKNQIRAFIKNNRLKSGVDARFKKDQEAWNKGIKGINFGGENGKKTQFKNGDRPWNYQPVGTERVNTEGYVDIKIADPNKWRAKHKIIWEESNGPVPNGHVIIFGDGNRLNVTLDNLILISRKQLSMLNKHNLIQGNVELTRTGIIVADIYLKMGELKKASK